MTWTKHNLRWDTYWNLPHLPDLTGSSPCPNRPGGKKGDKGAIPHLSFSPPPSPDLAVLEAKLVQSNVELVRVSERMTFYYLLFTYCHPSRFSNLPPPSLALFNLFRHHKMMLTIALRQYSISIQENWTLLVYQTFTICSKYFWSRIYTLILHETFRFSWNYVVSH